MRFQFVLVGAILIGAPWVGGAAQRNDRTDAVRQIAAGVGRVLGAASAPATLRTLAAVPPAPAATGVLPPISAPTSIAAARGITDDEVRFGISAPFSGGAKELGRQMKLGIETAFNRVNDAGGIHGRQLRLVAADDGYDPARTAETMTQLYEKDQVFGIIGNV